VNSVDHVVKPTYPCEFNNLGNREERLEPFEGGRLVASLVNSNQIRPLDDRLVAVAKGLPEFGSSNRLNNLVLKPCRSTERLVVASSIFACVGDRSCQYS
jgi:hypothetical protein